VCSGAKSGSFCNQAYGAVVMDKGSYMWVLDANSTQFKDNTEEGLFAGTLGRECHRGNELPL
jgi:hypothetical protein